MQYPAEKIYISRGVSNSEYKLSQYERLAASIWPRSQMPAFGHARRRPQPR